MKKSTTLPPGMKLAPPDGGWGWVIVLGSSLINLSTRSIEPSFGLLFGDLLKDLGVATTGAAIIMSTLDAMINFSGLFVGPLIKRFSYRKVGLLGALLSGLALALTSSANSMTHIIITYSIIGGLGFGLATASTFVALNSYFSVKRGQAVGLAMAGTALGFMAMPQAVSRLLEEFDFRGTLLILAALALNAAVGASLLQPVKWHMKVVPIPQVPAIQEEAIQIQDLNTLHEEGEDEEEVSKSLLALPRNVSVSSSLACNRQLSNTPSQVGSLNQMGSGLNFGRKISSVAMMPRNPSGTSFTRKRKTSTISNVSHVDLMGSTMHICFDMESDDEDTNKPPEITTIYKSEKELMNNNVKKYKQDLKEEKQPSCWAKFSSLMDFDLLKDPTYLNILFGLSITYVAELNFKMVVPFFMANLGYSKRETAMALSVMAIADIVARVLVPPIYDRLSYSRRITLMFGCVCVATARSVLAEQTEWVPLIVCLVIHGFFRGLTLINFPLVISEYATVDKFAAAFGLSMVSKGCFIVGLGPLNGWIRDYTGSYPICIHTQSVMIMMCVVAWSIEHIILCRRKPKEQPVNVEFT